MVPLIAIGVVTDGLGDEPSEHAMRTAFEAHLTSDVQAVLDFALEIGGPKAVAKIHAAGTDRFEIRAFQKLNCVRSAEKPGYFCDFMVDVGVVNGVLQSIQVGHFFRGSDGLVFAQGL
jgi:hypothetical protein